MMKMLLPFLFFAINGFSQSWQLYDDVGGSVTDIEIINGQRYTTFKTGELLRGDSVIRIYPVQTTNETGLHSVTFWHDSLCVYLSSLDSVQRVICGTDTLLSISFKNPWSNRHRGGGFVSTPKTLYVGVGSGNDPNDAQDSNDYRGKIVAIRSDTTFIYALGLRNPWKMDLHNEDLYIADVGDRAWEEVDRIDTSGNNLGWPCYEGNAVHDTMPPCGNVTFPYYTYPRMQAGNAIIGGVWFQGAFWWCDNFFEFGGRTYDSGVTDSIPCPVWPTGMYSNGDTLFVYDYAGRIFRWNEGPLSIDTIPDEEDPVLPPSFIITSDEIIWNEPLDGTLIVLTIIGDLIVQKDATNQGFISLSDFNPGMYVLSYVSRHGVQWSKLIPVIR